MIELIILFYIVVFLLGSIPFGLIFSRVFYQRDITGLGSGNIGTTNVSRVFGFWPVGFLTLFCDVLKGVIPLIVLKLGFFSFLFDYDGPVSENVLWLSGFISVLGHCYSPFLRFQGGKGVATSFGCFLLLSPWAALIGIIAYVVSFVRLKTGSIASLMGVFLTLICLPLFYPLGLYLWFAAGMVFIVLLRHEKNLDDLLK